MITNCFYSIDIKDNSSQNKIISRLYQSMSQDFFMRDDIIEVHLNLNRKFNNKLDSDCFNIKAYRKRKSKSKKVSVLGALTTDLGISQDNILKSNNSLQKQNFSGDQLSHRRISMTAGINRRADLSDQLRNFNRSVNMRMVSHKKQTSQQVAKTAKINYSANKIDPNPKNLLSQEKQTNVNVSSLIDGSGELTARNKYKELQEKYNKKGQMNDRAIQNWLNQILMEYCHEEHFDKSIQNAALKKMSIDRNSLLSQGINPDYVNRVYKSMFVYSIGFNNLLKQLSGKNTHLKKTIWKVYAILLQFCSEGTFETMIGQIQRDKARKVESLREEIQKRQRIIENNDEINEQKNAKIFKELKILREQNINLENEKNVLMEDFKEAEQSFNQEVSLRLKFQNKINQIHGIHHELSTKHNRLYEDYHKKNREIELLQQKHKQLLENYLIIKQKLTRTASQLEQRTRDNSQLNELISKYEQMRTRFENSEIELKSSKEDLQNIIKQKSRKISQLQVELENSEIMLNLSKSSSSQLQEQYKEQLQQNKKLHSTIRDQITQLNQLFTQKKGFNQKHMSYVAQIEFLKNKDSENKINIQKLKRQLKELTENNQAILLDKITLQKKVQTLDKNLNQCFQNIQNMKKTKNIYEEQLVYLKKKSELHGEVVREKDSLITRLTKQNQKLTKENSQLITLNKNLDSKASVLAQKLRSQEEINKKKYDKLKEERDQLFKDNSQHNAILTQKITQLERYMSLYDKEMLNLKNQRFERVNLDLRYKQSLQVMESQNQHIRKLNIIISQNHEEIQQWKRKHRNFQYILKEKERLFQVETNSLKMLLDEARSELNRKKMFVNPMLLEDLKGLLKRAIQKHDVLLKQHNKKIIEFTTKELSLNTLIQTNKKQQSNQLLQEQSKWKKKLQQKEYELEHEKQKRKHSQQKMQEFQKIINQNKNGTQNQGISKQKERKYLATIKQKSEQIEKLLKQLQTAHDHNNTIIKRISEMQEIISSKNRQITEFEKKYTKLTQQIQALEKQKHSTLNQNRQHQTLSSKMDDYDENLLGAMNSSDTHQGISFQRDNPTRSSPIRQPSEHSNRKITSKEEEFDSRQDETHLDVSNRQKSRQKSEKVVNPVWRNDFGKKLKNAFNYYQK